MHSSERMKKILTSEAGRKMFRTISPVYYDSFFGLWIFQVMGTAFDEVNLVKDDFWKAIFPQTAPAWALEYWEKEYDIPVNKNESIGVRRDRIVTTIKTRAPMNPYKLEQIASAASGVSCRIVENISKNKFAIYVSASGSEDADIEALKREVNKAKPAHLIYDILYEQGTEENQYPVIMMQTAKKITLRQVN